MIILRKLSFYFILIFSCWSTAQETSELDSTTIPDELLINANAVVRKNDVLITVKKYDEVEVTTRRVVTILNKKGLADVNAAESYDKNVVIKDIEAIIYDKLGDKIARFKEDDFKDVSAVSSGTLYSDSRVKYLDYTASNYPFTVVFTSKVINNSTAFLPSWLPLEYFYISTQSSTFKIVNKSDVALKIKESNLDNYSINKTENSYEAKNLLAIEPQSYSPDFSTYGPTVKVAMKKFKMEGVDGYNDDWLSFGKWMNNELLTNVDNLPQSVVEEIKYLTSDADSEKEKAQIVYKFMQDRSRYISVQVGIGGWKPINAYKVHDVAYGDCKGLSNYTKALLNKVGIKSHHAVIYGGRNIRSIDKDFSSTQGNHMILYIPKLDNEEHIWLECTSKTSPFGYIAGFTDDRDALVIKENGGEILHTTVYETEDNLQKTNALITISKDGSASSNTKITSNGYQYSFKDHLEKKSDEDLKKYYSKYWSHLNGLEIANINLNVNKDDILISEDISLSISKYASKTGNLLLIKPVIFNRNEVEPTKYKNRYADLEIDRGYLDIDEYEIKLEDGLKIDALPEPINLKTKFGEYQLKVNKVDENTISVYRYLKVNKGYFDKSSYEDYREFRAKLVKYDNSKAVLQL